MNYFEFYDIPVSFKIDETKLKNKYFELSKKFHPDYHLQSSPGEQSKMLGLSSLNNNAYKTLLNFDSRIKYILELKGQIYEGEKHELPKEFLMEMMEVNEALMEMEMAKDEVKHQVIIKKISSIENELFQSIQTIVENYDDAKSSEDDLKIVKDYYYKKKYLLRLKESLKKFES